MLADDIVHRDKGPVLLKSVWFFVFQMKLLDSFSRLE